MYQSKADGAADMDKQSAKSAWAGVIVFVIGLLAAAGV